LNGQEIAVKRLSKSSTRTQDVKDFKNEIVLMAKLQHRNLVRFLGFCLEGDEKILSTNLWPTKALTMNLYIFLVYFSLFYLGFRGRWIWGSLRGKKTS
jgi:serine/threonine protein kinase